MRLLRYSWESLLRNRKKTVLNLAVCVMTVVLLNVFAGNVASVYRQLDELPRAIKVDAVISNLCGSMDEGLNIKREKMEAILDSEYIESPVFTARLKFGFGEFGADDYLGKLNYYACAANGMSGIRGLVAEDISMASDMTADEFFSSVQPLCLVDASFLERNELSIGDDVMLTCFCYRYEAYQRNIPTAT